VRARARRRARSVPLQWTVRGRAGACSWCACWT
jgi:hypothetical protein